jgi:hypothetical protein
MARIGLWREQLKRRLTQWTWAPSWDYVPPCLWSKGISQLCDVKGPDSYWRDHTESCQPESFFHRHYADAHGLVWVRLSTGSRVGKPCDLDNFVRAALPSIQKPFVLITTDGDASVPSDIALDTIEALLACPWLVSWYTQNCDDPTHAKLAPVPIGLDLHTPRFGTSPRRLIKQLRSLRSRRLPLDRIPLRVFCDLGTLLSSPTRKQAIAALSGCDHIDFQNTRLSQTGIWRRYADYPFVLSAPGNGLDCHRTWELLYLGSIVITKTSSLDPLFDGLPVVIVDDWTEVADKANLVRWLERYRDLTDQQTIWRRLAPDKVIGRMRETLAPHQPQQA